ncbi:FecR domain-containing protein [Chitinophaga sp. OAE865]|uniref:FecR family protein n=1 Tax=Chitinophaga sp. OAE865 TaxID=2817898 RepID=UPI001AE82552
MSNGELSYGLLGKYFSGEASPEEAMAVDDWVRQHPDHRRLYDEAAAVWDNAAGAPRYQLPDKGALLREIKEQATRQRPRVTPWRIAAALLLLLGAAVLYFVLQPSQPGHMGFPVVIRQTTTGIYRDTLPDHSLVVLNSHSSIKYPPGETRQIQLTGEAWFNVTSDPLKPFIVSVGDLRIEVLGTAFNVRQLAGVINVAVSTGAVKVSKRDTAITVKTGQQLSYDTSTQRFSMGNNVNPNETGYATRIFNFEDASLKEITAQLERAYGIKVILENERLGNCTMSSAFENKPIQYVFEVISITLNVQCRFENDRVYISGAGCN